MADGRRQIGMRDFDGDLSLVPAVGWEEDRGHSTPPQLTLHRAPCTVHRAPCTVHRAPVASVERKMTIGASVVHPRCRLPRGRIPDAQLLEVRPILRRIVVVFL